MPVAKGPFTLSPGGMNHLAKESLIYYIKLFRKNGVVHSKATSLFYPWQSDLELLSIILTHC